MSDINKQSNNNERVQYFPHGERVSTTRKLLLVLLLATQVGYSNGSSKGEKVIDKNRIEVANTLDNQQKTTDRAKQFDFAKYKKIPYSSLFGKEKKELSEEEKEVKEMFINDFAKRIDAIKGTNGFPIRNITFSNTNIAKKYGLPTSADFAIKDTDQKNNTVTFSVDKSLGEDPSFASHSKLGSYQIIGVNEQKVKDPVFEITIGERKFIIKSNIPGITLEGIKMVKNKKTQKLEIHIPVKAIGLISRTIKRDGEKRGRDIYNCYFTVPFGGEKIIEESVKIIDITGK